MPLMLAALLQDMPGAAEAAYPDTRAAAARAWAKAVRNWASGILPASTTIATAVSTLESALLSAFALTDGTKALEQAFAAFAATVAAGMAPAFVALPPPGAVGFAALFAGPRPLTCAQGVALVSMRLDTWMRTGTATPAAGGPPVRWS